MKPDTKTCYPKIGRNMTPQSMNILRWRTRRRRGQNNSCPSEDTLSAAGSDQAALLRFWRISSPPRYGGVRASAGLWQSTMPAYENPGDASARADDLLLVRSSPQTIVQQ